MRIFIDMDGVLCDFYGGVWDLYVSGAFGAPAEAHAGHTAWPYRCRRGDWDFYEQEPMNLTSGAVAKLMTAHFYANLNWLPDGRDIVKQAEALAGADHVYLLTAPWDTPGCEDGKKDWIERHLPNYKRRCLIGTPKEAAAAPGHYLLDDAWKNCDKFNTHGGRGVIVPRPWNTLHTAACMETGAALSLHPVESVRMHEANVKKRSSRTTTGVR